VQDMERQDSQALYREEVLVGGSEEEAASAVEADGVVVISFTQQV